jgi:hypothetical protein
MKREGPKVCQHRRSGEHQKRDEAVGLNSLLFCTDHECPKFDSPLIFVEQPIFYAR